MKYAIKWDIQHTLILAVTTFGGAVVGYLESQQPASLFEALGSWQTAKPLVYGALFAGATALLALAKQTFLTTPPSVTELPGPMIKTTPKGPTPPTAARKETLHFPKRLGFAGFALLLSCQAVAPAANLGQCILADVAKGDSIAQIALDCGADVPSVIIALLESADPNILNSKAHAEAVAAQTAVLQATAQMAAKK